MAGPRVGTELPTQLSIDVEVARRLAEHASTKSQKGVVKFVEERPVMQTKGDGPPQHPKGGANGIALSPDGSRLYFSSQRGTSGFVAGTDGCTYEVTGPFRR